MTTAQPHLLEQESAKFDRLIVHQFDASRPSPGGIDTCIRGILRYASATQRIGVVGVDTGEGPSDRELGRWEEYQSGGNTFYFLPVVRLDPADQSRRVPHAVRLLSGLTRYRRRIPETDYVQAHRADTAVALWMILRRPLTYFIHTQESGLTGSTSDSFWRRAAKVHHLIEMCAVRRAERIAVFNPDYARVIQTKNPNARGFPTWYDPALLSTPIARNDRSLLWVGRVEIPKDPLLAISVYRELSAKDDGWTLDLVGSGTLAEQVRQVAEGLPGVTVHGRTAPELVAQMMGNHDVFLMTSHAGYEGFPRVLVEAMASGMRPVVTDGSDTGGLIKDGDTGFVTSRSPKEIAEKTLESRQLNRERIAEVVASFSAPKVIADIYR